MVLNKRKNIRKILKSLSALDRQAVQYATGVNSSRFKQIQNALQEHGFITTLTQISTKALLVPSRLSTTAGDRKMIKALCELWSVQNKEKSDEIHGYIATYVEGLLGVIQEELAICHANVKEYLGPKKTITLETANMLIKEHSILSNTWYTMYKKKFAKYYKTLIFLTFISVAWKAYQLHNLKTFKNIFEKNWAQLQDICTTNKDFDKQEMIKIILLLTGYTAQATLFYDITKNEIKSQNQICQQINIKNKKTILDRLQSALVTIGTLFSPKFLGLLLSSLSSVDPFTERFSKAHKNLQLIEENIPHINSLNKTQNMIITAYFGQNWQLDYQSLTIEQIRSKILSLNPITFATVLFNLDGSFRSKENTLEVLSLLG